MRGRECVVALITLMMIIIIIIHRRCDILRSDAFSLICAQRLRSRKRPHTECCPGTANKMRAIYRAIYDRSTAVWRMAAMRCTARTVENDIYSRRERERMTNRARSERAPFTTMCATNELQYSNTHTHTLAVNMW